MRGPAGRASPGFAACGNGDAAPSKPPTARSTPPARGEADPATVTDSPVEDVPSALSAARGGVVEGLPEPSVSLEELMSGGLPPDGIPPIDEPAFLRVADVDFLADNEPVTSSTAATSAHPASEGSTDRSDNRIPSRLPSASTCRPSGAAVQRCRVSADVASGPPPHSVDRTIGNASPACEAVLHMDGQLGIMAAHRTPGDMFVHPHAQVAVEFAVDERIDVTPVAEMVESHHDGGNPTPARLLPAE